MIRSFVAACCAVALLAACGSDANDGAADPTTTPTTTPVTATTNTAAPQTTFAPITIPPPPESSAPDASQSTMPTETGPVSTMTPDTEPGAVAEYTVVESPEAPESTETVAAEGPQIDGLYYAIVSESTAAGNPPDPTATSTPDSLEPAPQVITFELVQLWRGEACLAHFGDIDDACVNDYGVETNPSVEIDVQLAEQYISVVDAATQESHQITGGELYRLIHGELPAAGAPPEYMYTGFGYFATIEGGQITRLQQWWTP